MHEKELFASEVVGAALVHGNVVITLASVRFDEPAPNAPPNPRRGITSRTSPTSPAARRGRSATPGGPTGAGTGGARPAAAQGWGARQRRQPPQSRPENRTKLS